MNAIRFSGRPLSSGASGGPVARLVVVALVAALLSISGCTRRDGAATQGSASGTGSATAVKPAADDLLSSLREMANTCEANLRKPCKAEQAAAKLVSGRATIEQLPVLVKALSDKDAKVVDAAARVASRYFNTLVDYARREPNSIKPASADALLAVLAKLKGSRALRMVSLATHVATFLGKHEALYKVLDAHEANVRRVGYAQAARYGRARVLPKLTKLAQGKDLSLVQAALASVAKMRKPTDAEKTSICPWAAKYLGHDDSQVVASAIHTMIRCGGAHIDAFIAALKKRVVAGKLSRRALFAIRPACRPLLHFKAPASDAQCEKLLDVLELAANNKKIDANVRGLALWSVGFLRPDANSKKRLSRYLKSKEPNIARQAKLGITYANQFMRRKGVKLISRKRLGGVKKAGSGSAKQAPAPKKK